MSKTCASCFIRGSKHLELGLRPRAFICFSVFGTPDETLALVFDILHESLIHTLKNLVYFDPTRIFLSKRMMKNLAHLNFIEFACAN